MRPWTPKRVFIEERALEYPLGQELHQRFRAEGTEVRILRGRLSGLPGKTAREAYAEAKRTLVVGVRKTLKFETSKPSADYAIPLVTGCPGHCTYCYLQTTLGPRPAVRVYVNLDEILARAGTYIQQRLPDITTFEGACTSDPVSVEHITGALAATVRYFAGQRNGRFRFVTKYEQVDGLLDLPHNGHTRIRFSVNTDDVIQRWELATATLDERLRAAARVAAAGYPTGLIIAPIFLEGDWQEPYEQLLLRTRTALDQAGADLAAADLTFELITHRFTPRAKALITDRFPETTLPMAAEERRWQWGQFGYGKYVYPREELNEAEVFFRTRIAALFPAGRVQYII